MHILRAPPPMPKPAAATVDRRRELGQVAVQLHAAGSEFPLLGAAIHEPALGQAWRRAKRRAAVAKGREDIFDSKRRLVLLRMGRNADAIAAYDSALKLRPDAPPPCTAGGIAKLRSGDRSGGQADVAAAKAIQQELDVVFEVDGVRP